MHDINEIYHSYVRYCFSVGHFTPPSFAFWLLLTTKGPH